MSEHSAADERRFRSTVGHYLNGRPPYAGRLIRRVAELTGLQPTGDMLDLGCGPGQLARAFAPLARQVVAMDPEPEMLGVAAEAAAAIANIRFVAGGSADLSPALGRFRLVVMGRSFHWMDRAETLRRLDAMVEPGGAVVHFDTQMAAVPENDWMARYNAVRRQYTTDDPDHPKRRNGTWLPHEAFMLASAFSHLEGCFVVERREFEAASLIDRVFSMSSSSPHRLGERAAAMQAALEAVIQDIAPQGRLTEVIISNALIARRPG